MSKIDRKNNLRIFHNQYIAKSIIPKITNTGNSHSQDDNREI